MGKMVQQYRPQMAIWGMHIACWIPKSTNTQSEYVTLIALPLQQWLRERASMLCSNVDCLYCWVYFCGQVLVLQRNLLATSLRSLHHHSVFTYQNLFTLF